MTKLEEALREFNIFISEFNNHMAENMMKDMETKKQLAECKKLLIQLLEEQNAFKNNND